MNLKSSKSENSFFIQDNGVKVITVDNYSIVTQNKIIRRGGTAVAYFVCGFWDSIFSYERYRHSPHVTLYKTEAEVKAYCDGKVVGYKEFYAETEHEVDELIAINKKIQINHAKSLREDCGIIIEIPKAEEGE